MVKNKKNKTKIYIFIWILVFIVGPVLLANKLMSSFFCVSVSSNSMAPTIEKGDKLMVWKTNDNNKIKKNDVIIFYSEELGRMVVKRVIGIPGDVIKIDEKFNLKVNGEDIIKNSNLNLGKEYKNIIELNKKEFVVPAESYFVVGDNFDNSFDSRFWNNKFVTKSSIIGKAIVKKNKFKNIIF